MWQIIFLCVACSNKNKALGFEAVIVPTAHCLECLLIAFLIVLPHSFLYLASLLFRPNSNKDLSLSLCVSQLLWHFILLTILHNCSRTCVDDPSSHFCTVRARAMFFVIPMLVTMLWVHSKLHNWSSSIWIGD